MASQNNGTFPIPSKSPLLTAKQQFRPNMAPTTTLRMSDQNDYLKPAKDVSKMMSSQSTTTLTKKPLQDPFSTMQMQEVLEGKNTALNVNMNPCTKHPKKKVFSLMILFKSPFKRPNITSKTANMRRKWKCFVRNAR